MNAGRAIEAAKLGHKVIRSGWNGKGMYVFDFIHSPFCIKDPESSGIDFPIDDENLNPIHHMGFEFDENFYPLENFLLLKTAAGTCIPWNMSQADILAEDYEIIE